MVVVSCCEVAYHQKENWVRVEGEMDGDKYKTTLEENQFQSVRYLRVGLEL